MEAPDFYPLGTVCVVRGSTKKLMIISRGVAVAQEEGQRYFDYGGCLYPEGLMGDTVLYFNHDAIQEMVFEGYVDDDEQLMLDNLAQSLKYVEMEKGNPAPLTVPEQMS